MREKDCAFFILAALHHDLDFLARLKLDVAFGVGYFGDGHQAFGLEADVHHDMGGSDLNDGAFKDIVFTGRRLCFQGVRL